MKDILNESYCGYLLESRQEKKPNGRYAVAVRISRNDKDGEKYCDFTADDSILYILEVEAAKEALNLGRNLIDRNLVEF